MKVDCFLYASRRRKRRVGLITELDSATWTKNFVRAFDAMYMGHELQFTICLDIRCFGNATAMVDVIMSKTVLTVTTAKG